MRKTILSVAILSMTLCGCGEFSRGFQAGYHFKMGDRLYRSGDNGAAEKEFKTALDASKGLWQEKAKCLVRLGQIYNEQNKKTEAESSFKEGLEIFSRNEDTKHMRSNYLNVRTYWILGLHQYASFCKKNGRADEATQLEAKARMLESANKKAE